MNQASEKNIKSENFDQEFKKILRIIRKYIPYINSNAYLMQCRIWLEKLSNPDVNKVLRNLYLIELCEQIKKNKLLPPFNEAPPSGPLKSLTRILPRKSQRLLSQGLDHQKSRTSCFHNTSVTKIQGKHATNDLTILPKMLCSSNTQNMDWSESDSLHKKISKVSIPIKKMRHKLFVPIRLLEEKKSSTTEAFQDAGILQNNSFESGEPAKNVQNIDNVEKSIPARNSTETVLNSDNDSWSDLTDISSSLELVTCQKDTELEIQNMDSETGINRPPDSEGSEIGESILKVYGVHDTNLKIPKDVSYISEDWKNTIEALQVRLSETTQQNNDLSGVIRKLETEMEELRNKNKEATDQKLKMVESLHAREIVKLNESHAKTILQLEKTFQAEKEIIDSNYHDKVNNLTGSYEQKILEMKEQCEEAIKNRNEEINRLTEIIQQQCLRVVNGISTLQNEVLCNSCDKKLGLLKKCISKMDRLFQKSEKEYLRQIENLRQEVDLRNNALQIQLKIQKAEFIAETSSERQEEFDKILNSLEGKYIKMLDMHEQQIMKLKKEDDENFLTPQLLSKPDILYDEHD